MPPRKDLGALLVDEDVLDAKDLERLRDRRPLWSALIDAELATAEQIFRALSARFGVPAVSDERLAEVAMPAPFRLALASGEAKAAGLLPIDISSDGQRATVVMVDPSDEATLAAFLTKVRVPEGRALLGRRDPLLRAIDRCFAEATAVVTPLAPPKRPRTNPNVQPPPPMKMLRDEVTGTVKLDPGLQAELQRLPPQLLQADPLTPLPRRPRRPTPPATPAPPSQPLTVAPSHAPVPHVSAPYPSGPHASGPHASPPYPSVPHPSAPYPSGPHASGPHASPPYESDKDALRAEERLTRALVEAVEALASELEARLVGGAGQGAEMARLSRRVARQLGLSRRAADEIGVAAQLFVLDRIMRNVEGASADLFGELGWAAAGEDGLVPVLRALTAVASGFGRASGGQPPLGTRVIGAVADYVELTASAAAPDLDTVSQLLRASPAGAVVVDALLRVLEIDRGDVTPELPTVNATSVLRDDSDDDPTPPPRELSDGDKTLRKPLPRKKEGE